VLQLSNVMDIVYSYYWHHIPATWRRQYTGARKPCQAACRL